MVGLLVICAQTRSDSLWRAARPNIIVSREKASVSSFTMSLRLIPKTLP